MRPFSCLNLLVPTALLALLSPPVIGAGRFIDEKGISRVPGLGIAPEGDRLLRQLSGISLGRFELGGSAGPFSATNTFAGFADLRAINIDMPLGQLTAGKFELSRIDEDEGFRFRATFLQSHSAFFCISAEGTLRVPYFGKLIGFCRPDSRAGVGFTVLELQGDPALRRFGTRWLEGRAVLSLLGNGLGSESLHRRLDVSAGLSGESVFDPRGNDHHLRTVLALSGLLRTRDARWELNGKIAARPSLLSTQGFWSDRAWETQAAGLRHFPVSRAISGSLGLTFQYARWDRPVASLGTLASAVRPETWNLLLTIGGRFEFSSY